MSNVLRKIDNAISGPNRQTLPTHPDNTGTAATTTATGAYNEPRTVPAGGATGAGAGAGAGVGTTHAHGGVGSAGYADNNYTTTAPTAGRTAGTAGTAGTVGAAGTATTAGTTGTAGTGITGPNSTRDTATVLPGPAPNTSGPHRYDLLNRLDPSVDSNAPVAVPKGAVMPGPAPNTAGPHRHDVLNKIDPTVDSDMSNPRTAGRGGNTVAPGRTAAGTGAGTTTGTTAGTAGGAHHSRFANIVDPTGTGRAGGLGSNGTAAANTNTVATGPAPTTNGPHRSDLLNKLDPRVDSQPVGRNPVGPSGRY